MSEIKTKIKKIASLALASTLAFTSLNASDLLSKATGGVINNNSFGIKKLDDSQMSDVKGGYAYGFLRISQSASKAEIGVIALPDYENEIGIVYGDIEATKNHDYGICALGVTQCYYNKQTQTHLQGNRNRMVDFVNALGGTFSVYRYGVVYTVSKEMHVDRYGNRYPLFKYGVGAYDRDTGSFHRIDSSAILNNNIIIRELRDAFKGEMEGALNMAIR